ncbi:MAG TPA: SDR family oxidoreductase [Terracidiphilus sp.]|nr:SDR family oxidoreductase [Terracidiphilus sp.]
MADHSLTGKAALVTGGARRIGRAIAIALANAGADVAITYLNSKTESSDALQRLVATGVRALAVECDVRSEQSVHSAVAATVAVFGRLDLLVNNAAVFATSPLDSLSLVEWDTVFETNARGPFLMAREALPHLKAAQGRIVNIGSLGGLRAWATHAHYSSSKAALHTLTQAMAKAFAPQVTVNCVAPGSIDFSDQDDPLSQRLKSRTPMLCNGSAEDVAQAVLFFATGPRFITGQILSVDGGLGLT